MVDLVWAIAMGIVGGFVVARIVRWIDRRLQKFHAVDGLMEDFIALSTILIAYAFTEIINGYGFLAVFVAGMAMRRRADPEKTMSQLHFVERLEKLSEIGIILVVGSMLRKEPMLAYAGEGLLVAGFLLFLIRPIGAWISTIGLPVDAATRWLYGWFGVRGVGSVYYLSYALSSGLKETAGERVAWISLWTIVISVVLHGVTTTPIMKWYERNIEHNPNPANREEAESG